MLEKKLEWNTYVNKRKKYVRAWIKEINGSQSTAYAGGEET